MIVSRGGLLLGQPPFGKQFFNAVFAMFAMEASRYPEQFF